MKSCPVPHCIKDRDEGQLLCAKHWFRIPHDLQKDVWHLFRIARGTLAHQAAIREVITLARDMSP